MGLIGQKLGMTRLFDEQGRAIAVTLIQAGPNYVTQIKTPERDGYLAVQLGFKETRKLNRPARGHLKGLPPLAYLREVPLASPEGVQRGAVVTPAEVLRIGELVDVTGTSKGRGFAGVVKRHGFRGGPKTHGQSDRWRAPGSIGSTTTPGRVFKGTRMAGRMGGDRVTVRNLEVVRIDPERNIVAIKGAVPGPVGGLVIIKKRVEA